MSFLKKLNRLFQSALSLQTHFYCHTDRNLLIFPKVKKKLCNCFSKRISFVISITSEGSMTIEAALVIPIFLFAIMAILSFGEILRLQMNMDSALQQCAKELAVYGYAGDSLCGSTVGDLSFPAETLFSELYIRNRVISELGEDYLDASPAEGSASLHLLGSRIMEDDRIEIHCSYYVTPFFSLSPKAGFLTESTAVARAFTGYDNLTYTEKGEKEEYVYITTDGTVYHRKRDCHYLDLSIEQVFTDELSGLRNAEGSVYHACSVCGQTSSGSIVFITSYGNKYHSDLLCSGLRRTVKAVPLSEVGARGPCQKCGY